MNKSEDHRYLAKDLDLYTSIEKSGQGLIFLLPNFIIIRNIIQQFIRQKWNEYNFLEVATPIVGDKWLYETSGHLKHYLNDMYPCMNRKNETKKEEDYYLRPMTCPHHCLIYEQKLRSYKELPFRISENSLIFRYESSGSLKGLERVRNIELADHHIFTSSDKLKEEIKKNFDFIWEILEKFNLAIIRLICCFHDPDQPEKYHSDENMWQRSENLFLEVMNEILVSKNKSKGRNETKLSYIVQKDAAAFYGPKIDVEFETADNKHITLATIQIDFLLPQKFNLCYLDKEQKKRAPVLIHQTPIGSYQRFIALLLEQTKGKLPVWLSPCQLVIIPVNDKEETMNRCEKIVKSLKNKRAKISINKSLNYRIRQTHQQRIPYYIIIGEKEVLTDKIELVDTRNEKKKIMEVWKINNYITKKEISEKDK